MSNGVYMACYERRADLHSTHEFTEPRYFEKRREIPAHQCITFHKEHSGRNLANIEQFRSMYPGNLKEIGEPIQPTHSDLATEASFSYDVPLQNHRELFSRDQAHAAC